MFTEDQRILDAIVRTMSPAQVKQVISCARGILQSQDQSDDLSETDLAAIGSDGLRRFAEEHPEDDWGYDKADFGKPDA